MPFLRAVRAEWTKLRTAPSTAWLVLVGVAAMVALGALVAAGTSTRHCPTPSSCPYDTTKLSLIGVHLGQIGIAVLSVLAITNEYATRMIQSTLTAVPRRAVVWASKLAVVTAAALTAGVIGVVGSVVAARQILPGNGFTVARGYAVLPLADEATRRAAIGTVLYLGLIALLGVAVGAIVRDTAGALTTVLGLLYLAPMLSMVISDPRWHRRLERYAPMTAGLAVQATRNLPQLPIGPWAGLGLLAVYVAAAVLLAAVLFVIRDA
jgi:hypothetical protein